MRKLTFIVSVFALAVLIGAGFALVSTDSATACGCPFPDFHQEIGGICLCPSGVMGNYITRCLGYWEDGSECCCYTYCSACPPSHVKGPYPAIDPGEEP